jgi:hypothetical protein
MTLTGLIPAPRSVVSSPGRYLGQEMIVERIARVLRAWTSKSEATAAMGGPLGPEPVVRLGTVVPLQMRCRAEDGRWIYRDPTEAEILDFLASDAW